MSLCPRPPRRLRSAGARPHPHARSAPPAPPAPVRQSLPVFGALGASTITRRNTPPATLLSLFKLRAHPSPACPAPLRLLLLRGLGQVAYRNIAALLALGVRQGVARPAVPRAAMLHDVDGGIHGAAQRLGIGLALPRDIVGRAVVGRGAHLRESGREVHPVGREHLERSEPLVVVHGQHRVVAGIASVSEEPVGRKRSESQHAAGHGLGHGRTDDLLLLAAQQPSVARMGIERQHGDARLDDTEVAAQRRAQRVERTADALPRDVGAHLRDGEMDRHQPHAQPVAAHDHHRFAPQLRGQELGVAGEAEPVALHRLLVDRGRHQRVDAAGLEVVGRTAQCGQRRGRRLGRRTARLHGQPFAHGHHIYAAAPRLVRRGDFRERGRLLAAERGGIELRRLRRSVNHRRAELRHARIGERPEHDLPADTVGIALRDTYSYLIFRHKIHRFNPADLRSRAIARTASGPTVENAMFQEANLGKFPQ